MPAVGDRIEALIRHGQVLSYPESGQAQGVHLMSNIQFGLVLPAEGRDRSLRATWVADLNRALTMVAGHFDSAWMVDHLQFGDIDVLEGFTALSYLAALHPRLRFGHAVLCQTFRNPALLAKMAATLQFISGGRYILGLGAGWNEEEYRAYGYGCPSARVRVQQLAEAIQIIRLMWREESATFAGEHYQIREARCEPHPDPAPPLMIGAFGPKMLRLTARYADWWNVSNTGPEAYRSLADEMGRACAEVGRDPATMRRSWVGGCACAETEREAADLVAGRWSEDDEEDYGFVGTPVQVLAQMRPFIELGIDTFMFDTAGFPDLTGLELLIREVLPGAYRQT